MKTLKIKKFVSIGYDFDDTRIVAKYSLTQGSKFSSWEAARSVGRSRTAIVQGHLRAKPNVCFFAIRMPTASTFNAASCASSILSKSQSRTRRAGNSSRRDAMLGNPETSPCRRSAQRLRPFATILLQLLRVNLRSSIILRETASSLSLLPRQRSLW